MIRHIARKASSDQPDEPAPPNTHQSPVDAEMVEAISCLAEAVQTLNAARLGLEQVMGMDDVKGMVREAIREAETAMRECDHERRGYR